ncbi:MAG: ectonucleotide pyrophosphatase/phosphodiesterase [Opitutaceae bacterium]|jgi:predicted AlkP superfamily pyrophosphatase or phosphodiesterase|nr:ectonucleotide pyrophosphatase/phosphodiesterase [Opitutaceae bacterium]
MKIPASKTAALAALVCLFIHPAPANAPAAPAKDRTLIIVSIDGLPADYIDDARVKMPVLRRLIREGARAGSVASVFPTVTWANHTSIITGVTPARHGVLGNTYYDRKAEAEAVLLWDPRFDKTEIVAAPTLYDVAHAAGLKTAGISWPASRNAPTLDWQMPCVIDQALVEKYSTPSLLRELEAKKIPYQHTGLWSSKKPPAHDEQKSELTKRGAEGKLEVDRMHALAAVHVLEAHKPNLLLLHLDVVDAFQHQSGRDTEIAREACEEADRLLGRVVEAIEKSGRKESTTLFVLSDHGFRNYQKQININIALRDAGLVDITKGKVTGGDVAFVAMGGGAGLYIKNGRDRGAVMKKLLPALNKVEGLEAILLPEDLAGLGQAVVGKDWKAADVMLSARDGYAFSTNAKRPSVIFDLPDAKGAHGYLPGSQKLKACFVAWGAGIKAGVTVGEIKNMDVAPTGASLLGLPLPGTDGRVLGEILK